MKTNQCLYCYQTVSEGGDFHPMCSKKMFGSSIPPILDYTKDKIEEIAKEIVLRSVTVTGVQPKLSINIAPIPGDPKGSRFTIVGLWGAYILKPPTSTFPNLPENEDLTMHLAMIFGIRTAEHTLMRLTSGELAYITKRFDRCDNEKLATEDMCQLTETLTNDKYRGSMEKIGRHIEKYSSQPGLDKIIFFEMALFSFLTGNADMHVKNFSLLTTKDNFIQLSPAYDMVNTKLALPEDVEELALTLNARKRKITKNDFDRFAASLGIPEKAIEQSVSRFSTRVARAIEFIRSSFLNSDSQEAYITLLKERAHRVGIKSST